MTERQWCTACGTVSSDGVCDCNRYGQDRQPQFVNYADAMQEDARKVTQEAAKTCNSYLERALRAEALVERLKAALLPFSFETLPHTKRTLIDYDRNGLRRAISPMEVATRDAWRAVSSTALKCECQPLTRYTDAPHDPECPLSHIYENRGGDRG